MFQNSVVLAVLLAAVVVSWLERDGELPVAPTATASGAARPGAPGIGPAAPTRGERPDAIGPRVRGRAPWPAPGQGLTLEQGRALAELRRVTPATVDAGDLDSAGVR